MFDGSHYPIEENIEKTRELVKVCNEKGISLEAEVGSIGGEEDGVVGMGECADPKECKMIADLGVTMLAAGMRADDFKAAIPMSPAIVIPDGARKGNLLGQPFDP